MGCVALGRFDDERAEFKRLCVVPAARGRGHGGRLARVAIACGRALGYRSIVLDTLPSRMPDAGRLYRALGFREGVGGGSAIALRLELRLGAVGMAPPGPQPANR